MEITPRKSRKIAEKVTEIALAELHAPDKEAVFSMIATSQTTKNDILIRPKTDYRVLPSGVIYGANVGTFCKLFKSWT